jgi:hypothetical protein
MPYWVEDYNTTENIIDYMTPSQAKFLLEKKIPLVLHPDFTPPIGNQEYGIPIEFFKGLGIERHDLLPHKWFIGSEEVWHKDAYGIPCYSIDLKGMTAFANLSQQGYIDYQRYIENGKERGG